MVDPIVPIGARSPAAVPVDPAERVDPLTGRRRDPEDRREGRRRRPPPPAEESAVVDEQGHIDVSA